MYNYQNYGAYMPPQQQSVVQPQYPTIYGKVVDSYETARSSDVPIGTYAIFPKGDLSEMYCKSWNPDGTTRMIAYSPKVSKDGDKPDPYIDILRSIQKSLEKLVQPPYPKQNKAKEVSNND